MIVTSNRARIGGAVVLFLAILALELVLPDFFAPVVAFALLVAPAVNWRAYFRLREKLRLVELRRRIGDADYQAPIVSLRTATNAAFFLAIASTVTASLGIFVALRALNLVEAIPREVFLVVLAYPPLLATGPAFDWLATVGRLDADEVAARESAA